MEPPAKVSNQHFNTPFDKKLLSKDSRIYIGHIVMHDRHLIDSWSKLDPSGVITGIA
jgi:hypothetical protein